MSIFLGPIHHTMHKRILIQDTMTEVLLAVNEKSAWIENLSSEINAQMPATPEKPLEHIIDTTNIHGSLSAMVAQSERRFAITADRILAEHPERIQILTEALDLLGRQQQIPDAVSAPMVFQHLNQVLLDGMPCDRAWTILTEEEYQIEWQVKACPHVSHWHNLATPPHCYYTLRKAFVDGILADSNFLYHELTPSHFILKARNM